jgi:hypothetical protein
MLNYEQLISQLGLQSKKYLVLHNSNRMVADGKDSLSSEHNIVKCELLTNFLGKVKGKYHTGNVCVCVFVYIYIYIYEIILTYHGYTMGACLLDGWLVCLLVD